MGFQAIKKLWVGAFIISMGLNYGLKAETANTGTSTTTAATESDSKITGMLDLRPSWTSAQGEFHMEELVSLGYQFQKNVTLDFNHNFTTNLLNPSDAVKGVSPSAVDMFARLKVNNVYKFESVPVTLSYEARAYVPIVDALRDAGMVTAIRNYAKFSTDLTSSIKLTLSEVPIVHIYSVPGSGKSASPAFENRIYLIGDFKLTDKLSLSVPVMLHMTKYREFAGAANSATWGFFAWVYPELGYEINDNYSVSVAYYNNDSLVASDMGSTNFGPGFESGVFQVAFTATL